MILPSYHEGFGYAYLEAAAQGNALLGFEIVGPDVLLSDNVTGFAYQWIRPLLAAQHISLLYSDRRLLAKFMRNAWRRSLDFDRESVIRSIHL